jgi:hypothetical protein
VGRRFPLTIRPPQAHHLIALVTFQSLAYLASARACLTWPREEPLRSTSEHAGGRGARPWDNAQQNNRNDKAVPGGNGQRGRLPPLVKADEAIVVRVDLVKEAREPSLGHGEPRPLEGHAQLLPTDLPIVIMIDGLEEAEQLALSSLDKDAELCTGASQDQHLHKSRGLGRCSLPSYWILPSRLVSTTFITSPSRSSAFFKAVLVR